MFRSDSVVDPAKLVVSFKMSLLTFLIFLLNKLLTIASIGTVSKKTGAISQLTVNAYQSTNINPTNVWKTTLIKAIINFSESLLTF